MQGVTEDEKRRRAKFRHALHTLWLTRGQPSTASLARRTGMVQSTVHRMLCGEIWTTWGRFALLLQALEADLDKFWEIFSGQDEEPPPVPQPTELELLQQILVELRGLREDLRGYYSPSN